MLFIKRLTDTARIPKRANDHAAAYDLYSDEYVTLEPGKVTAVDIGIATEFPPGYAGLVWDRSGMGKKGIHVFGGVVDCDYRGEWIVLLLNSTDEPYEVAKGDRIAQVVFQQVVAWPVFEVQTLHASDRGANGFGSTGK
jgi:dUTP pyrophosphatase